MIKHFYLHVTKLPLLPLFWVMTLRQRVSSWCRYHWTVIRSGSPLHRVGGTATSIGNGTAIGCFYYRMTSSQKRVLRALVSNGLDVILIVNRKVDSADLESWAPFCVDIFERPNYGADFGAYRDGFRLFWKRNDLSKSQLMFFNDSIYYFDQIEAQVKTLIDGSGDACCLFINKQFALHAQSFLLLLKQKALEAEGVRKFLTQYRPRYSKVKTIKKGEVGLSRIITKERLTIKSLVDSRLLQEVLRESPEKVWEPEIQILDYTKPKLRLRGHVEVGFLPNPAAYQYFGRLLDSTNTTHTLPLTLTRASGLPLKLDLLDVASCSSLSIQEALTGHINDSDLREIASWFNSRSSWASFSGIQGAFQRRGIK